MAADEAVAAVRAQFPALQVADNGRPRIYFDNPAGTQVPRQVIDRITDFFTGRNANIGGHFVTSYETQEIALAAQRKLAAFYNAADPDEIVVGQSMTTLTFHMTRAIEASLNPGDEIIVTRMDHDGNVTPWLRLAERRGLTVKYLPFNRETYRYELADLDALLSPRTRLMAVNYASNITGTINDVAEICRRARAAGALTYVDAVQYAPHGVIDVQALGCDAIVSSAYKFYGPHVGILWARRELLERFNPPKLRVSPDYLPSRYMLGTAQYELFAGLLGALDYYELIGTTIATATQREAASCAINAGKLWMQAHEEALAQRLIDGLKSLKGVRILGITDAMADRVSTVSFAVAGRDPADLAKALGKRNIFAWNGNNYALDLIDWLGLADAGGALRLGPVHYNTAAEVDTVVAAMDELLS